MSIFNWRQAFSRLVSGWRRSSTGRVNVDKPAGSRRGLHVEGLEERCLPSSPQQFVAQLYVDLLQRPADPGGLATWSGAIEAGVSPSQVVFDLEQSPEYQAQLVEQSYQMFFNRPADGQGLSNWTQFLASNPVEAMQANMAASSEFFDDGGGTNTGFLALLYQDVLHRDLDSAGLANFGGELAVGVSRYTVAYQVLSSPEYQSNLVNADYERYLGRPGDGGGIGFWVGQLESGGTDQEVVAALAGSGEYMAKAPPAPTVTFPAAVTEVDTNALTISGTAEAGSYVQIYDNGQAVGAEQLPFGSSNYGITVPLADDSGNSFAVTATNLLGNQSPAAGVPTIVQTTHPITVMPPANQANDEGDTVSGVPVTATDINSGVTFTYGASALPKGLSINNSSGIITGTVDAGDSTSSPYIVTVSAGDGFNSGTATFTWTIGIRPTITAPAAQANNEGDPVSLQVIASDPDGAILTYRAVNLPPGLRINNGTGLITGDISNGSSADSPYTVTLTVSDGVDPVSTSFNWTVTK